MILLEVLVKKLKISLQADGVTDRGKRKILFTNAGFSKVDFTVKSISLVASPILVVCICIKVLNLVM